LLALYDFWLVVTSAALLRIASLVRGLLCAVDGGYFYLIGKVPTKIAEHIPAAD
jgi:hypothetical protein